MVFITLIQAKLKRFPLIWFWLVILSHRVKLMPVILLHLLVRILHNGNIRLWYIVGNKAKGRISKRVFQENKACQIFRKTTISYQGVRNVCFSENLACFVFFKYPFSDSPFCLITDDMWLVLHGSLNPTNYRVQATVKSDCCFYFA